MASLKRVIVHVSVVVGGDISMRKSIIIHLPPEIPTLSDNYTYRLRCVFFS